MLIALAAIGSCGKDQTTALDLKLQISGALDQVRIDMVSLDGNPVPLTDEPTRLFPASARMLKTGDVQARGLARDARRNAFRLAQGPWAC